MLLDPRDPAHERLIHGTENVPHAVRDTEELLRILDKHASATGDLGPHPIRTTSEEVPRFGERSAFHGEDFAQMAHHVLYRLHDLYQARRFRLAIGGLVVRLHATPGGDVLAQRDDSSADAWIELASARFDDVEL